MTDHYYDAESIAQATLEYSEAGDEAGALVNLAAAQVHATLALAEQQRIANLIALSQAEDGNGWLSEQAIAAVFREHWNDERAQGHCTLAPDIAAALRIPPQPQNQPKERLA